MIANVLLAVRVIQVKQLLAVDGRLHMDFNIASTGSAHNYTRSYYINGRDYIISGSCDEKVVRICCSQTGRRLRDVYIEVHSQISKPYNIIAKPQIKRKQ